MLVLKNSLHDSFPCWRCRDFSLTQTLEKNLFQCVMQHTYKTPRLLLKGLNVLKCCLHFYMRRKWDTGVAVRKNCICRWLLSLCLWVMSTPVVLRKKHPYWLFLGERLTSLQKGASSKTHMTLMRLPPFLIWIVDIKSFLRISLYTEQ